MIRLSQEGAEGWLSVPLRAHIARQGTASPDGRGSWTQRGRSDTLKGEHWASLVRPNSLAAKGRSLPRTVSQSGVPLVGAVLRAELAVSQPPALLHACCCRKRLFRPGL
uniref:Uncharacterized protein n=1 Tax=Melopsittacus undulatus TaxID=13146 RepID=A0A8V5H1M9_MELUD